MAYKDNKIGNELKEFKEMLKINKSLKKLDLKDNLEQDDTCWTLCQGNEIGDDGLKKLAAGLKENTALTELDLSGFMYCYILS